MATKKTTTTTNNTALTLQELKAKLNEVRLSVAAGIEKNTNAQRPIKKQIAQLLTKATQTK